LQLRDSEYKIILDLDLDRIRTIMHEAYKACADMLQVEFTITEDEFVARAEPFLTSNRISTAFPIRLPSKKYPEMVIEVNPRRKSVFARMVNAKKQAYLNYFLNAL